MVIAQITGIIALIVFLLAYIGKTVVTWFTNPSDLTDKIINICEYIATGALTLGAVCGIITLFD